MIDADSLAIPAVAQKTPRQGIWQRWRRRRRERTRAARSVETPPELADALVTAAEERNPAPSVPLLPRATISNSGSHLVMAYLLGPFTLVVNGQPIEAWHGTRGRSVLKYLLAHHGRPVPRDVLMDAFWRDIGHAAARNSLNVALSNLRRTLRPALGDVQPILHEAGAYRLNPDLDLWVDVDEFEQRAERGFQLHAAGELAGAASELARATSLYRGPYQEDDPYAETAILTRDRLRVLFLEVLDQLGDVAFVQGRYDDCIALAQAMLGHDRCREDAHRRIMRCYGRQSRTDLALRQYQACVAALRDELDVEPSPASTELYAAIRQHRAV